MRRSRLLALPALVAVPLLALGGPAAVAPTAAPSDDRRLFEQVFQKGPGAHELADRVARDFLPVGVTNQAFDAVGTVLGQVTKAKAIPSVGKAWRFAGPKDGYYLDDAYSTAPAHYGHSSGIVTGIAADSTDPTGNTVLVATHGGLFKTTNGGSSWTDLTLGKIPRLGIGAVAIDPANHNRIFIGTGVPLLTRSDDSAGTGLYVSSNGGGTWTRGTYSGHGYGVSSIAVSPTAVFAATADGLYRSTNHGTTWVRVPLKTNAAHTAEYGGKYGNFISDVAVRPGMPNVVMAAVGYGQGKLKMQDGSLASVGNGLYQSTDGGNTFSYLSSTSQLTNLTASDDPIGVITLHYSSAPGYGNVLYAILGDAGKNRGDCEGGLPVPTVTDPVAGLNLTGALCASVINGFYRSLDGGATWSLLANYETLLAAPGSQLTALTALGIGPGYQTGYNKYIADDPTDPSRIVLGLEESYALVLPPLPVEIPSTGLSPTLFQTINKYWDTVGVLEPGTGGTPPAIPYYGGITTTHPDQHIATFVKVGASGSRLYAGNDGGIWSQDVGPIVSGDNTGATDITVCEVPKATTGLSNCDWKSLNNLPTVLPYHANMKPDGIIVAGLQDNGTIIIDPKTGKGTNVCGGDGVQVGVTANPKVFYCSTPAQGVQATTDGGHTFTDIYFEGTDIVGGDGLTAYAVDPTDGNHLMRAGRTVVETTAGPNTSGDNGFAQVFDAGSSGVKAVDGSTYDWSASGTELQGSNAYVGFCPGIACRGVVTNVSQNKQLIATNVKAGCKNAKRSSACWHRAAAKGLGFGQLVGLAIDPQDPKTVYASMNTYNFIGLDPATTAKGKVFVSHNAGESFTDITANLPRAGANNVVLIGKRLFVATEVGAFTKLTTDSAWRSLGTGLPGVPVRDLQADLSHKHLTASMFGRGVWTLETAGLTGLTAPAKPAGGTKGNNGGLAATGLPVGVAALALLLLATAAATRRRHRRL